MSWISVKERLPEHWERVLATNAKGEIELVRYKGKSELSASHYQDWYVGSFEGDAGSLRSPEPYSYEKYLENVILWQPLPKVPNFYYVKCESEDNFQLLKEEPKRINWKTVVPVLCSPTVCLINLKELTNGS